MLEKLKIIFPHKAGSGGPGSFQQRIIEKFKNNGYSIHYCGDSGKMDIVFVVGSTSKLFWLFIMKWKGAKILYRLDGISWLHSVKGSRWPFKEKLKADLINLLCKFIHAFLADYVVYQSEFVKNWWDKEAWVKRKKNFMIINNGISLSDFYPRHSDENELSLICLEGYLDYSPYAITLLNNLHKSLGDSIKLKVYGGIKWKKELMSLLKSIDYRGVIKFNQVKEIYKDGIYLSLDVNPACPNTVIEALASGVPVVGFDTGSLKELVDEGCGIVVPYGSDPWKLGYPDVDALRLAILKVQQNWKQYSVNARASAEKRFNISKIAESYIGVIDSLHINR
jgi:glycosyltransferase involved in cell wall biosynthesis